MKLLEFDFTPHQPYLEHNTVYYSYQPGYKDDLYGLVWEVYQVDNFDSKKTIAFPDVCADIMAFYTSSKAHCYVISGTKGTRSMTDLDFIHDIHSIFGVKFCSGALGNLFGEEARDTGDNIIAGNDALLNGKDDIARLLETETFTGRWDLVRQYLTKRLQTDYEADRLVNFVANYIVANHGKIRIEDLESITGYSNRYIRKKINEGLGVSIKTFCEIVQFQWSYHLSTQCKGKLSMTDLALQAGFYDQSHMNIIYKKLTGLLPRNAVNLYK